MSAATIIARMRAKNKQCPQPKQYVEKEPRFRLPDGARFEAMYDGVKQKWTVNLIIGQQTYTAVGSGLHWALRKCGKQWNKTNQQ